MWNEPEINRNRQQTKEELKNWWNELKNIPVRYNEPNDKFRHLLPNAYRLVDTSDLDEWIENYDFNQRGNQQYHRIMGKKFHGWRHLDENYEDYPVFAFESIEGVYALEKMSQKVLARCYIVMNRLLHGEEPEWEAEINRLANNWVRKTLQTAFEEHTTETERNRLPQLLREALENQTLAQQLQVRNGF